MTSQAFCNGCPSTRIITVQTTHLYQPAPPVRILPYGFIRSLAPRPTRRIHLFRFLDAGLAPRIRNTVRQDLPHRRRPLVEVCGLDVIVLVDGPPLETMPEVHEYHVADATTSIHRRDDGS